MQRSRRTGRGSFRSRTARSLLLCITVTCHQTKTIKSLAKPNLSFPGPRPTFSLWSRTQKSNAATAGWETWRRRVYEKLLPLPREGQSDRPCLYSLCTLIAPNLVISQSRMLHHVSTIHRVAQRWIFYALTRRRASESSRSWIEAQQDAAWRHHEAIGEIDLLTGCVDISKLRGEGRFFKNG